MASPATAGTSFLCSGAAMPIASLAGLAAGALDLADMATGGSEVNPGMVIADVTSFATFGLGRVLARAPAGLEAATRIQRLDNSISQRQLIDGGLGGGRQHPST